MIKKIQQLFHTQDYWRLGVLLGLMIVAAFIEMLGIGLIMPIINVLSDPQIVETSPYYAKAYAVLRASDTVDFVMKASACLVVYLVLKNLFLTYVSFYQSYFTARKEAEVSTRLLQSYLDMPYEKYITRNSADLLRNINQETSQLFLNVFASGLVLISELFVALALFLLLLLLYPVATLIAMGCGFAAAVVFIMLVKKPLSHLGEKRIEARGRMLEWATQGLYGLKELVVAGRTDYLLEAFSKRAQDMAETQGFSEAMSRIPRLYIETVAILLLLAVIMYVMRAEDNLVQALILFGLVTFRILPSINRIAVSATRVRFFMPALDTVIADLKPMKKKSKKLELLPFKKRFVLDKVSYRYPGMDSDIINRLTLKVKQGEIISIVGPSGAGKSTLLDTMLGLIQPQQGEVTVDAIAIHENLDGWRQNLSYLPQFVYLLNASIRENVAFGVAIEDIDDNRVRDALAKAELVDFVNKLPQGLDSQIGDIGGKVSGGQRQRIGIARALYHGRKVLFLDEATTGLDPRTEAKICATLKSLAPEVTIISVSHQQTLIDIADKVYRLEKGSLHTVSKV